MVKIITIPKSGKFVIPKDVRQEIGLTGEEQYVLVADEGDIILRKINRNQSQEKIKVLLDNFRISFKKAKITRKDVETAIKTVRARNEKA